MSKEIHWLYYENEAYLVVTNIFGRFPVIHSTVPEVCIQTITITAQMDRISRARCRTLVFLTENAAIRRNIGDITTV